MTKNSVPAPVFFTEWEAQKVIDGAPPLLHLEIREYTFFAQPNITVPVSLFLVVPSSIDDRRSYQIVREWFAMTAKEVP